MYVDEGPERGGGGGGVQIPFPIPNFAQIPVPSPILTTNSIPCATNPNANILFLFKCRASGGVIFEIQC